ncbi:MAG TPA: hypothetical protein VM581_01335 [Magnetospirillaceae bacterium]|nr:hypothetical protein [Magnetospirillaceae bacterium]
MPEEQIDVVDPQGRFIGVTKDKSKVHADGDWHMTVHIVVTDGAGRVLEQFRGPDCKLMRMCWDPMSIAGHISAVIANPSDAPALLRPDILHQAMQAGIREGAEEIGLEIDESWFFTERLRFFGITRTNNLTNEGYTDRWWDRALSINFMLVMPGFTATGLRLEPGKVLDVRMRHVDDIERVLRGELNETYADRQPDHNWLLASTIDTARRIAAGY